MLYKGFRNLITNSSINAALKNDIKDAWLATNKGRAPEEKGSTNKQFQFSGYWTIKNYNSDVTMFCIAMFFEIAFLLLVFMTAGFQLNLVIPAILSVAVDFISALGHTKNRSDITKSRLKLDIAEYQYRLSLISLPTVNTFKNELKKYKNNIFHILGTIFIVLSWLVKIYVTAATYALPIFIFAAIVIFGFVAYIHQFHTAYFFLGSMYYSKLKKTLVYGNNVFSGQDHPINDFLHIPLDNVGNVILFEIRKKIENGVNIDVYNSLVKEEIDGKTTWSIKLWRHNFLDDKDMLEFLVSCDTQGRALAQDAQAFILSEISQKVFLNNVQ